MEPYPSARPASSQESALAAPYEFDAVENETLQSLGDAMSFVGIIFYVFSVLYVVQGVAAFARNYSSAPSAAPVAALVPLIQGVVCLLLGRWTQGAGRHFTRVATTQGGDIPLLMMALGELLSIYRLQRTLFIVMTVLIVLVMTLAILLPVMLAMRMQGR